MSSGEFYVTNQIAARDDGLRPMKLPDSYSGTIMDIKHQTPDGALTVSYESNSRQFKLEIRELKDSSVELEYVCEAISKFIMENVDEEEQQSALVGLDFEIEGCIWKISLNPDLGASDMQIHVTLAAKKHSDGTSTTWVAQTSLVHMKDETVVSKSELEENSTVTAAFMQTSLVIRKAILSCEFPEFPEGGKDKRFKEVYKLNAKVCSAITHYLIPNYLYLMTAMLS